MLFQADNCNDQIPAKTYEYLYAQKPVLGFTDPEGETGKLLHSVGIRSVAKLEDSAEIENQIMTFVNQLRDKYGFRGAKGSCEPLLSRKSDSGS